MTRRPVVYLLCGLTGSGKTTYAKTLEHQGVIRLSVDEEVYARHGHYGVDYPEDHYFALEAPVIEDVLARLIELVNDGRDVIFDHGLWRRTDRDAYKNLVETHGAAWRLLYFPVDLDLLIQRLHERNQRADANALTVTTDALNDFYDRFEEPHNEGEEIIPST